MDKASIIIPTFNNISGLNYLLDYFKDKPYQLIVVDNGKTQISNLKTQNHNLKLKTKKIIFLPQKKNLGFAKAVNLGAKYVKSEWMVVLNDDIVFKSQNSKLKSQSQNLKLKTKEKDVVFELIRFAQINKLDAVSPILRNSDGKVENVGYRVLSHGKIELIKEMDSRLRGNDSNKDKLSDDNKLDGLTAACLLIKTDVFKKLGGFDESFFAYLEDVDFFLRFKKAGYKMAIAYNIEVLHNHMTTSKTMGSFKARQDMINWWRLYFKHKDVFRFDLRFLVERLRNVAGYIKAVVNLK